MYNRFTQLHPDKKIKLLFNLCNNCITTKSKVIQLKDLLFNSEVIENQIPLKTILFTLQTQSLTKLRVRDNVRRKRKGFPTYPLQKRILEIIPTVFQVNNRN